MKPLLARLQQMERALSAEKGPFSVFALFQPDGTPYNMWHLIVSAPWATEWLPTIRLMSEHLKDTNPPSDDIFISRVIHVPPGSKELEDIWDAVEVEHGLVEIHNRTFLGVDVDRAYFITSRREPVAQPV